MPKQWKQRKLQFETYHAHYALGPDPEIERQQKREAHLKDIHRRLEEAQITYEPKGLKKKEKIIPDERFKNGKYCPWGNLDEMYPGQHEGKPYGNIGGFTLAGILIDPFFEPNWRVKYTKEFKDYTKELLSINGTNIHELWKTGDVEQQEKVKEQMKIYKEFYELLKWKIPEEEQQFINQIFEEKHN